MTLVLDTLQYENPVLRSYIFWSCVLIVKMLLMMLLTGLKRILTQVSAWISELELSFDIQSQIVQGRNFKIIISAP